ncbi:hypothetical protein lerEdw1_017840 [Lerista edwardsae]|nr:hypothetical protein lerEdw1_017840 [Lerista edwardsae]
MERIQAIAQNVSDIAMKVDQILRNSLLNGKTTEGRRDQCEVPRDPNFPDCSGKVEWMRARWTSDPCYAFFGVDGTECSFLIYLSEVEWFCPVLPWRNQTVAAPSTKSPPRVQILIHIGFLTEESGDVFSPRVLKGGPLGEMVQWADILAVLFILGHTLKITVSLKELQSNLSVPPGRGNCPLTVPLPFDLIYTDYHGLQQMKQHMGLSFKKYRCRVRVIDTFGTEPAYNHEEYATLHGYRTNWGYWNLNPKQFMTMFPHTPDNSFMGFVSEELNETEKQSIKSNKANNMAVVYGKEASIWKGKEKFLSILNKYMEIHGTVYYETQRPPEVPAFVKNHGLLPQHEFQQLLRKAKVSSQHPYAEDFIGIPHVWTVDYNNSEEFEAAIKAIMRTKVDPYLPYEYTSEGMLERIHAYIQYQDFCAIAALSDKANSNTMQSSASPLRLQSNSTHLAWSHNSSSSHRLPAWPPINSMQVWVSDAGQACTSTCQQHGLVCEPEFFKFINKKEVFQQLSIVCDSTESEMNHLYPAVAENVRECYLQKEPLLFSCAGCNTKYQRLCPCRDYRKGQVALCRDCL